MLFKNRKSELIPLPTALRRAPGSQKNTSNSNFKIENINNLPSPFATAEIGNIKKSANP